MKRGQMLFSGFSLKKVAKGFTLLEMLFVVVIVGIMSTIIGPRFFNQLIKSQNTAVVSQLSSFSSALDVYLLDNGHYPTTEQGLQALLASPAGEMKWAGPYLAQQDVPVDPFGNEYVYVCPSLSATYTLYSQGRDLSSTEDDMHASRLIDGLNTNVSFPVGASAPSTDDSAADSSTADSTSTTTAPAAPAADATTSTTTTPTTTASNFILSDPQGFTDAVGIIQ